jgi:putative heme-binding domain-containing protein
LGELNLDLEQRRRLLRRSSPDIQARAAKLFGDEEYSNRKSLVDDWLKRLPAEGDIVRGRTVFEKNCAQCHTVSGQGDNVGPDLNDVFHRSLEDLVSNILDPNMAINPSYVGFHVELNSDESEIGILHAESSEAITLLQAMGKQVVIPRKDIRSMTSSGISLMPEGLEAAMTPQDLRDLVAFLQQKR